MNDDSRRPLEFTPSGRRGKTGIDKIMDEEQFRYSIPPKKREERKNYSTAFLCRPTFGDCTITTRAWFLSMFQLRKQPIDGPAQIDIFGESSHVWWGVRKVGRARVSRYVGPRDPCPSANRTVHTVRRSRLLQQSKHHHTRSLERMPFHTMPWVLILFVSEVVCTRSKTGHFLYVITRRRTASTAGTQTRLSLHDAATTDITHEHQTREAMSRKVDATYGTYWYSTAGTEP